MCHWPAGTVPAVDREWAKWRTSPVTAAQNYVDADEGLNAASAKATIKQRLYPPHHVFHGPSTIDAFVDFIAEIPDQEFYVSLGDTVSFPAPTFRDRYKQLVAPVRWG